MTVTLTKSCLQEKNEYVGNQHILFRKQVFRESESWMLLLRIWSNLNFIRTAIIFSSLMYQDRHVKLSHFPRRDCMIQPRRESVRMMFMREHNSFLQGHLKIMMVDCAATREQKYICSNPRLLSASTSTNQAFTSWKNKTKKQLKYSNLALPDLANLKKTRLTHMVI